MYIPVFWGLSGSIVYSVQFPTITLQLLENIIYKNTWIEDQDKKNKKKCAIANMLA